MTDIDTASHTPTGRRSPRVAVNPVPYWVRDGRVDKSKEVFEEAFADFADIGFTAVKADVPEGMTAGEYAAWIGSYGLAPSLSLFSSPFDETINIADEMERAKNFAADAIQPYARAAMDDQIVWDHIVRHQHKRGVMKVARYRIAQNHSRSLGQCGSFIRGPSSGLFLRSGDYDCAIYD